jgi:hypothetical protein
VTGLLTACISMEMHLVESFPLALRPTGILLLSWPQFRLKVRIHTFMGCGEPHVAIFSRIHTLANSSLLVMIQSEIRRGNAEMATARTHQSADH